MDRIQAVKRQKGHAGHLTYDIKHVWPDGRRNLDGLTFESQVHVYVREPEDRKAGKRCRIQVWMPGGQQGVEATLDWGEEWWAPVKDWGIFSAVSLDDVELDVFWELTPYYRKPDDA